MWTSTNENIDVPEIICISWSFRSDIFLISLKSKSLRHHERVLWAQDDFQNSLPFLSFINIGQLISDAQSIRGQAGAVSNYAVGMVNGRSPVCAGPPAAVGRYDGKFTVEPGEIDQYLVNRCDRFWQCPFMLMYECQFNINIQRYILVTVYYTM